MNNAIGYRITVDGFGPECQRWVNKGLYKLVRAHPLSVHFLMRKKLEKKLMTFYI